MQADTPKFKEWLAAEKAAHAAERKLRAAMLQFETDRSAPPLDEMVANTRALRARAHALFDGAMQELKELADSLHHRRLLVRTRAGEPPQPTQH